MSVEYLDVSDDEFDLNSLRDSCLGDLIINDELAEPSSDPIAITPIKTAKKNKSHFSNNAAKKQKTDFARQTPSQRTKELTDAKLDKLIDLSKEGDAILSRGVSAFEKYIEFKMNQSSHP